MSKTFPIFLPNKGIELDKPEEFLLPYFSPYSRNMEHKDELLQGRLGLMKFDDKQLDGNIQLIDQFWKYDGTWYLIVATTTDILEYDFSNLYFRFLTPLYTTGTIEVKTGELNKVYGSSTVWATNLKAGNYIKIGSGNVNTDATWYKILTVNSDTLLTLTSNAVITAPGSAYVARKTFTGAKTDWWHSVTFQDAILGEVWIATNGKDTPVRYTGSGQVQALSGLVSGFTAAKFIEVYKDRVMFAWTVEGGNQPQRERWSAVANCESWANGDFHDFIEDGYYITGICNYSNYHIVFRERDAYIGRYVGGTYIFEYDKSNSCTGCYSANSIITSDFMYYYGVDNKFKKWNLLREDEVFGSELFPFTKEINPTLESSIFGWEAEYKNQIRWFIPYSDTEYNNYCFVYDYSNESVYLWEYESEQAISCMGEYILEDDLYVDDPVWGELYVDEQDGYWDARTGLSGSPVLVYGGYDGYMRKSDIGFNDDGATYQRIFRTSRINFKMPNQAKRLQRQQYWFNSELSGSVNVKIRKDDALLFEVNEKTIDLINVDRDIIKENIIWDKFGEDFQLELYAENHFALLGFLNTIHPKRKTI